MKRIVLWAALWGLAATALTAQTMPTVREVPDGFREIRLGLELDRVKTLLQADPYFDFRGDPDVSMLRNENESLIETAGRGYVRRGYFQFMDRSLYLIILVLDEREIDHYSMYVTLTEKYGQPTDFTNLKSTWENDTYALILERPLSVKYLHKPVFESILDTAVVAESLESLTRQDFLDEF